MASLTRSSLAGTRLQGAAQMGSGRASRTAMVCQATSEMSSRRELLAMGALLGAATLTPAAKAGIVEELLEKSTKNKELNDKKRLYTSYANLARSRTVADGTCAFPTNFVGCDIKPFAGNVRYITDDIELECQGEEAGHCISEINMKKVAP